MLHLYRNIQEWRTIKEEWISLKKVMEHITAENYADMCRRIKALETDDSVLGSSNFGRFIKLFESDDSGWIDEINTKIE